MPESFLGEQADSDLEDGVVPEPATHRAERLPIQTRRRRNICCASRRFGRRRYPRCLTE